MSGVENKRENKPRCNDTFIFARTQATDQLIEQLRNRIQSRDVSVCVLHAINLVNVYQKRRHLRVHAAPLSYGINVKTKLELLGLALRLSLEEPIAQLRLRIE